MGDIFYKVCTVKLQTGEINLNFVVKPLLVIRAISHVNRQFKKINDFLFGLPHNNKKI